METEIETRSDDAGVSRRRLIQGAVAAGVGVAVYSSPVVSQVPAYATNGLESFSSESGTLCVWFSPNQSGKFGKWHYAGSTSADTAVNTAPTNSTPGVPILTVSPVVGGVGRAIEFSGVPNNTKDNQKGYPLTAWNYDGGGAGIWLQDANCEVVVDWVASFKQDKDAPGSEDCVSTSVNYEGTSTPAVPAAWNVGSSLSPINSGGTAPGGTGLTPSNVFGGDTNQNPGRVFYHSGRQGANATVPAGTGQDGIANNDKNRCFWSMGFRIRCK